MLAVCRSGHSVEPATQQLPRPQPGSLRLDRLTRIALLGDPAFRQPTSLMAIRPSDNGKQIVTISVNDTIRFWDAATGKELRRLEMPEGFSLYGLCFMPDGKRVLSMSAHDSSKIKVWDLASGALYRTVEYPEYLTSPVVSPDGRQVFAADSTTREIIQFDLETGAELRRFTGHTDTVLSKFDLTPDGRILVTSDGFVRLWDVASGNLLRQLDMGSSGVQGFAVAPRGGLILGFGTSTLRAWDIQTGAEVWRARFGGVSWAFSPDGKAFAAQACDRKGLYIFDTASGKEKSQIDQEGDWFSSMTFSRDGRRIFAGQSTTLCGYDVAGGKRLFPADNISGQLAHGEFRHLAASPDARKLYSGTASSPVVVWDVPRGVVQAVWDAAGGVESLDLAPDGRRLVVSDMKHKAFVLDTATGKTLRELTNPAGHYWQQPCWVPSGGRLIGLCYQDLPRAGLLKDGMQSVLQVWTPDQGQEPRSFPVPSGSHLMGCGGGAKWVLCGGTRDWVVSVGNDHLGETYVYFIGLDQGAVLSQLTPGLFHPIAAALTPDDRTLVVLGEGGLMSC